MHSTGSSQVFFELHEALLVLVLGQIAGWKDKSKLTLYSVMCTIATLLFKYFLEYE